MFIQWNIICLKKEENSDTCYNMDDLEDNMLSEIRQSHTQKTQILYDSIYMRYLD
jgi:hypothetical protein